MYPEQLIHTASTFPACRRLQRVSVTRNVIEVELQ
jgi:hypothetical protein